MNHTSSSTARSSPMADQEKGIYDDDDDDGDGLFASVIVVSADRVRSGLEKDIVTILLVAGPERRPIHLHQSREKLGSFPPGRIFHVLYEDVFSEVSANRVLSFEQSRDVVLRSGFVAKVKTQFEKFARASPREALPSAVAHRANLCHFKDRWRGIKSNSTCLSCLRREPQFALDCGHAICENCVVVFGEPDVDDPWVYKVTKCFLCQVVMPKELSIRIHPPTAGAGVLCVDGGGIRGVAALRFMEKIHARVGLPIPFQRFTKVAVGVSSGGLIVADVFLNGTSVEHATEKFKALASIIFQRRNVVNASFLPRFLRHSVAYFANTIPPLPAVVRGIEFLLSYFADGLYPPHHIEKALKEVFSAERGILDWSYATSTGTRVGLPVATVDAKPSCRLFTNYNGVGERKRGQGRISVLRWEKANASDRPCDKSERWAWESPSIGNVRRDLRVASKRSLTYPSARAASAALGFFPPKHVGGVGTFQDAGPLENSPLVSTLSEVAALFPLAEEPDFVVSLGTGEPELGSDLPADPAASRNVWKNGAFPRLCRLFWEKMRDRKVSEAFQACPRYHRLNVRFEGDEPRLDDLHSISYMESKVEQNSTLSHKVDAIARCFVASLFYFELDGIPERLGGRYIGTGHVACFLRRGDPLEPDLMIY
ncbi:hypothetical protein F5B19DRAFT_493094 [Rostrohypoxylon terebratum]|nr:hypothetical protein F5B19DRAFT_493094 [Rostrohypoxylon terebratum]